MNGLMSQNPCPAAVRLAVAATGLLQVQAMLVLHTPDVEFGLRVVVGLLAACSTLALTAAMFGESPRSAEDRATPFRRYRHGR